MVLTQPLFAYGTIAARQTSDIGALAESVVDEIFFRVGDRVEENDPLFQTRQTDYQRRLIEAQAMRDVRGRGPKTRGLSIHHCLLVALWKMSYSMTQTRTLRSQMSIYTSVYTSRNRETGICRHNSFGPIGSQVSIVAQNIGLAIQSH